MPNLTYVFLGSSPINFIQRLFDRLISGKAITKKTGRLTLEHIKGSYHPMESHLECT